MSHNIKHQLNAHRHNVPTQRTYLGYYLVESESCDCSCTSGCQVWNQQLPTGTIILPILYRTLTVKPVHLASAGNGKAISLNATNQFLGPEGAFTNFKGWPLWLQYLRSPKISVNRFHHGLLQDLRVNGSLPLLLVAFTTALKLWLAHCQNMTLAGCLQETRRHCSELHTATQIEPYL